MEILYIYLIIAAGLLQTKSRLVIPISTESDESSSDEYLSVRSFTPTKCATDHIFVKPCNEYMSRIDFGLRTGVDVRKNELGDPYFTSTELNEAPYFHFDIEQMTDDNDDGCRIIKATISIPILYDDISELVGDGHSARKPVIETCYLYIDDFGEIRIQNRAECGKRKPGPLGYIYLFPAGGRILKICSDRFCTTFGKLVGLEQFGRKHSTWMYFSKHTDSCRVPGMQKVYTAW